MCQVHKDELLEGRPFGARLCVTGRDDEYGTDHQNVESIPGQKYDHAIVQKECRFQRVLQGCIWVRERD